VPGGGVFREAAGDAGPGEPGGSRDAPRHGGRLEPADLLHPPDVQLRVRAPGGQRIQAAPGAPGREAARAGFGVIAGGALETGQVCSRCPPQLISERHRTIGGH
jgi:hypothetical protein